jgi:DnaK suppressor protein
MIDQVNLDQLRQHILAEQEKVKEDIAYLTEQSGPVPLDTAIGRITRMDAIGTRKLNEAKLGDAKSRLVLLDHALARIDRPDFGLCVDCGEPISLARLRFMPESRFCIDCAS